MPNTYIEHRDRWLELSAIDYLGAFTNAWLAFNAWYRSAYTETQDRKIINEIKDQPNVVRNKIVPLLRADSEEGEQMRAGIGALHHRLENYHIHSGKGDDKERIAFTKVYLRDNASTTSTQVTNGIRYEVVRGGSGVSASQVACKITSRNGSIAFQLTQTKWNLEELQQNTDFVRLNANQRGCLLVAYQPVCPKVIADLTQGAHTDFSKLTFGAHSFGCAKEDLFAGVVEVVYLMRCTLFHGELVPSKEASHCYEPAYRLVRQFLQAI